MCLEDNSRAASDGQEKSCHFQSYQGRGKPCRHCVIILKVFRLGRIVTAVFVMHVNMGKELMRALASPGKRIACWLWAAGAAKEGAAAA